MKSFAIWMAFMAFVFATAEASKTSKRCTWSILRATSACKYSCKVLGHTTGACTPDQYCYCSGKDYDFFGEVGDWIEEKLSIDVISERMNEVYQSVKDKVQDFSWMKDITISKCKLGGKEFCRRACHSIGRVDGVCNADNTDCDCTDEQVSFRQFRLCASESVCRVYCQNKGSVSGECVGETGWDCTCSSASSEGDSSVVEETTPDSIVFGDSDDYLSEFDNEKLRRKRSLFGF